MNRLTIKILLVGILFPLISSAGEVSVQFTTAKKLYDLGKHEDSISFSQKALKLIEAEQTPGQLMSQEDADKVTAIHSHLGKTYKILNDYELAIKEFNEVDGMSDSTDSCASYFLGEIYYLQNNQKYAATYWTDAIKRSYDIDCLLYAYVMHYITTEKDELPWKLKDDKFLRAIIEFWDGKLSAESLIKEAVTTPHNVFVNYIVGKKNLVAGRRALANEYFKQALQTNCYECVGYDLAKNGLKISK